MTATARDSFTLQNASQFFMFSESDIGSLRGGDRNFPSSKPIINADRSLEGGRNGPRDLSLNLSNEDGTAPHGRPTAARYGQVHTRVLVDRL